MLTRRHMFVSSSRKHMACDLKAVFGGFFSPLHNAGCKTVMLQNDIVQIWAKLLLHAILTMFSAPPYSLGETCNICWCVCSLLCPAQGALVVPGFFLQTLSVHSLICHLAMEAEVETSSVRDADPRDVARNGVFPVLCFHEFQTSAACELYAS